MRDRRNKSGQDTPADEQDDGQEYVFDCVALAIVDGDVLIHGGDHRASNAQTIHLPQQVGRVLLGVDASAQIGVHVYDVHGGRRSSIPHGANSVSSRIVLAVCSCVVKDNGRTNSWQDDSSDAIMRLLVEAAGHSGTSVPEKVGARWRRDWADEDFGISIIMEMLK